MMTKYVAPRVLERLSGVFKTTRLVDTYLNPVIPIRPGTCPAAILMAEPVIKPLTAGSGMNSTIHPRRSKPIPKTMKPQMKERVVAISGPVQTLGCALSTWVMI